jgi:hypothetical protein
LRAATRGLARRAEQGSDPGDHDAISAVPGGSARTLRGKPHHESVRRTAGHGARKAAHGHGGAPKHLVQVRKRSA